MIVEVPYIKRHWLLVIWLAVFLTIMGVGATSSVTQGTNNNPVYQNALYIGAALIAALCPILYADKAIAVKAKKAQVVKIKKEKAITKEEAIGRIRKMMSVSTKINLGMMRDALDMDAGDFNKKIFDWAAEFGFTIDGDYLVTKKETVENFIQALDQEFATWKGKEATQAGKA